MNYRTLLQSLPLAILSIVMVGQIYSMIRQYTSRSAPVMVSRYAVDSAQCRLEAERIGPILLSGMRQFGIVGDANDVIVSRGTGDVWQIAVQLREPGRQAFDVQAREVKSLLVCGTSDWCEGKAPLNEYGANAIPLLDRKRAGEKIDLPGCAISEHDFHPVSWNLRKSESRIDLLPFIALFIEAAALLYLLPLSQIKSMGFGRSLHIPGKSR